MIPVPVGTRVFPYFHDFFCLDGTSGGQERVGYEPEMEEATFLLLLRHIEVDRAILLNRQR